MAPSSKIINRIKIKIKFEPVHMQVNVSTATNSLNDIESHSFSADTLPHMAYHMANDVMMWLDDWSLSEGVASLHWLVLGVTSFKVSDIGSYSKLMLSE